MSPSAVTQGINRLAVSQLRPDQLVADVERAWGNRWRPIKRKDAGRVWGKEAGVDCIVTIDVTGVVGSVSFYGNFPAKYAIEGLRLGMSLTEMQAARPQLQLTATQDDYVKYGLREYAEFLAPTQLLKVRAGVKGIVGIDIENPASVYPRADVFLAAPPGKYPAPSLSGAAPFVDPNLKLIVLSDLLNKGVIDLGEPEDLAMHVLGRYIELECEGYEPIREVYDYLVAYPLTIEQLAQTESLSFDGGSEIYRYVVYHWDGESGEFDVHSLDGIEHCPNIKRIGITALCTPLDLSPLRHLTQLESMDLACGPHRNGNALLQCLGLREVSGFADDLDDPAVIPALRAKGVAVKMYT